MNDQQRHLVKTAGIALICYLMMAMKLKDSAGRIEKYHFEPAVIKNYFGNLEVASISHF